MRKRVSGAHRGPVCQSQRLSINTAATLTENIAHKSDITGALNTLELYVQPSHRHAACESPTFLSVEDLLALGEDKVLFALTANECLVLLAPV